MRQKLSLLTKTMLLLGALMAGSGSAWADNVNVINEDFSTNSTIKLLNDAGWTTTGNCSMSSINGKALQIASGNGDGSAKTPAFSSLVGTTATLTFSHKSSGGASRTLTITGNNCKVDGVSSKTVSVASSSGSTTISITNASTTSSISFSAAKSQGTIIDDVVVYYSAASLSPLASIALSGTYQTTFTVGDEFSHEGMIVTATYENGNETVVTNEAEFSGYNMFTTGAQTVKVSYTEGEVTKTSTYGIMVKAAAGLAFSPSETTVAIGGEETVTFSKATNATVTFSVADETIATYNSATGKITGLKEGTTTITATSDANEGYSAGEATCTIKVVDPDWIDFTTKGYSNAEDMTSVVGYNGTVSFDEGSNSNGNSPKWYDSGSAVRIYSGNTITITAKSGYVLSSVEFNVTSGSMSADSFDKTVTKGSGNVFTLSSLSTDITYSPGSTIRIDKVKINVVPATLTKNVTSAGWATYAPEYPVSFGAEEAYIIDIADDTEAVLTEVSSVPAGTPVLLKGAGDHILTVVASSDTDVSDNCLKVSDGTITKADGVYVLADGTYGVGFYLWTGEGDNTLPAGKVYMEPNATTSRAFFALGVSDSQGISGVTVTTGQANGMYDLQGRRVKKAVKGLYIVDGKKVMKK